ncbi:MAG TPA: glycosyltransferase family 1 protein [Chloroflexi bacterium]|nr:glycosyltransferase family 1 protein [Chloroflexota bacterium]
MRIGIDARLVYYSQAGIGQYILNLVRELAHLDREDDFFILQSRKDKTVLTEGENFSRRSLWTPSHHRLEQWTLPLEIGPLGLDILHSPDFIPPFRRNCKSIITIHDLAFLLYPHFLTAESARYYGQIDQAVRYTDHIIAVSEATKQDAIRLLGVPQSKITVVYEAANPTYRLLEDKRRVQRECAQRYGVSTPFILFVSTIEPRKNLPTLLRAYRRLLDEYKPEVRLVVVGERGWLYDQIFALTEELNLKEEVLYLGRVSVQDLLLLYNAAQLLVHPALYEGFGLPPLEAMACGTPAIVAHVSSLPEVVGDAALLVDPEDEYGWTVAIWRVLTDGSLRAELQEKGVKRARFFSWEKAARETLALYRSLR